jgi:hypothetical protein
LRTTSFGSDSRNTFFHAEPTCLTIGPLTEVRTLTAKSVLAHDIYLLERTAPVSDGCAGVEGPVFSLIALRAIQPTPYGDAPSADLMTSGKAIHA